MKDIAFKNGDLFLIDDDIGIIEDSEAIISELYIFLNIRACHKDNVGNIVQYGELEYDQEQGIDFIYIFELERTNNEIKNHYISKIMKYYKEYITEIKRFDINRKTIERTIEIEFDYKTIYSDEIQTFKIESEV